MKRLTALAICTAVMGSSPPHHAPADLRGAWALETYLLKDGTRRPLAGRLMFTEREWLVLYFVTDKGVPQQGSAEAGTYSLTGDRLVFTHLYTLTAGGSGAASGEGPVKMALHDAARAPTEPCTVVLQGDRLTIHFLPSGNSILLRRTSGP